jgi:hypothetical protein
MSDDIRVEDAITADACQPRCPILASAVEPLFLSTYFSDCEWPASNGSNPSGFEPLTILKPTRQASNIHDPERAY